MLVVRDLKKHYGRLLALDGVSFELSAGEVMGFLGPNGAGKSTTMRIVTGYLPATSGTALVDGLDVSRQSLDVRRRVGYLPEHTPLYPDMRVREYLDYRARIKGVPRRDLRKHVDYVIERCWLEDRERQIVDTLSKGYRQRVGLADAMVANPKLLILDEPTIGLDPNQIREVRKLIAELAQTHTLLISTHILPEVEQVCDRAVIIARGRTVADDTVAGLLAAHQDDAVRIVLERGVDAAEATKALAAIHGVARASLMLEDLAGVALRLECMGPDAARRALPEAAALAYARGWSIVEVRPDPVTLEQIFVRLTADEAPWEAEAPAEVPA